MSAHVLFTLHGLFPSPVNSYSSSKTRQRCPLLWGSFTSLSTLLPCTASPFSALSFLLPSSRFQGRAFLLNSVTLLYSVWFPMGLHLYLLRALTWIHCCSSYSPNYIISQFSPHMLLCFISPNSDMAGLFFLSFFCILHILSLFDFYFSPVVTPCPFSLAPCSCDPQACRRGEWRLAAGTSGCEGHSLPASFS